MHRIWCGRAIGAPIRSPANSRVSPRLTRSASRAGPPAAKKRSSKSGVTSETSM
ncbi:hypothetical protein ACFQQB_48965 [Nonomuraea rubra]|uniref:hypothetical protein n=1 Tax=Nonomuraea rubra TaxID=46180 RepID=UPI003622644A